MDATGYDVWSAFVAGDDIPELTPRPSWHDGAVCRDHPIGLFFATSSAGLAAAKAICARGPVVEPCRVEALADASLEGVWGGLSDVERRQDARPEPRTFLPLYRLGRWDTAVRLS